MTPKKIIAVSLLHYKAYEELVRCLYALRKVKKPKNFIIQIIVVDNESNPRKLQKVKKLFQHIVFLPQKENKGVPTGFNLGYAYGIEHGADYLMMYSPDLRLKSDALLKLTEQMEGDKKIGLACCKMVSKTHPPKIFFVQGKLDPKTKTTIHVGLGEEDHGQYDNTTENDFLNCPMLIRRSVFESVGYFNDVLFQYYEDTDWHIRIKKAEYKIMCVKDAISWNLSADIDTKILPKKEYYLARNHLWFVRHNFSLIEQITAYAYTLKDVLFLLLRQDAESKMRAPYVFLGICDFFLNRMGRKDLHENWS